MPRSIFINTPRNARATKRFQWDTPSSFMTGMRNGCEWQEYVKFERLKVASEQYVSWNANR